MDQVAHDALTNAHIGTCLGATLTTNSREANKICISNYRLVAMLLDLKPMCIFTFAPSCDVTRL